MEQFDQLLTCCVCLDRYRNPKLLPCQHSFCMEPCMEGLVDYVRRQVKCPECRAEHRIPYQGVQAFPTNVTLQRFLELHMDITGELPDPTSNQVMERCQVCSEKSYCNNCAHCEKKICPDCKDAHLDVVKREITRLSSQVRRVLHRLEDALNVSTKNLSGLKGTSSNVLEEVDDLCRRFTKAIKDKGDNLRRELENYVSTELTTLNSYKTNLETEISNITSNCELVDKYVVAETTTVQWDDQELMDTKDLFLRTMEFIRNFEYEPGDRRIRFTVNQDPNTIVVGLTNFGDLVFPGAVFTQRQPVQNQPPPFAANTGIMRSKSDHRLVQQYRDMDEAEQNPSSTRSKYSKYGSTSNNDGDGRKFRSRFTRRLLAAQDDEDDGGNVRFNDGSGGGGSGPAPPAPVRVLDTDDAMKGPLSGIGRLLDSTRVLEKMVELENPKKKPTAQSNTPVVPAAIQQQMQVLQAQQLHQQQQLLQNQQQLQQQQQQQQQTPMAPWRQSSQEKSNSTTTTAAKPTPLSTPAATAVTRKQSAEKARSESESSSEQSGSSTSGSSSGSTNRKVSTGASFTTEEVKQKFLKGNTPQKVGATTTTAPSAASQSASSQSTNNANKFRRQVTPVASTTKEDSDSSSEDTDDSESSDDEAAPPPTTSGGNASKMEKTDIGPLLARSAVARDRDQPSTTTPTRSRISREESGGGGGSMSSASLSRQSSRDETIGGSGRMTTSSSRGIDEPSTTSSRNRDAPILERRVSRDDGAGPNYSAYRSRQPKSPPETSYSSPRTAAGSTASSRYGTSSSSPYDYGLSRSRTGTSLYSSEPESTSRLQSKYLNRSRHNLGGSMDYGDDHPTVRSSGNPYYTGRSSYLAKHRGSSPHHASHGASASTTSDNQRKSNSREKSTRDRDRDKSKILSRSKSTHELPGELLLGESGTNMGSSSGSSSNTNSNKKPEDEQSLSSWARYLKSKYGKTANVSNSNNSNNTNNALDSSSSHNNNNNNNSNTMSNSSSGGGSYSNDGYNNNNNSGNGNLSGMNNNSMSNNNNNLVSRKSSSPQKLNLTSSPYSGKKRLLFKFGSRGSDPGYFTWPRGIACGPDCSIVVADSSNHRIQQFDQQGNFVKEFGTYGNGDGEFDCLAGVAVNRIGQFIVSDRYNHRIQVFDPSGRFLRSFGSQGSADGKFSYPWGVTTDALGFIYVCDKENNRIQVFQSDGTFVGKFGSDILEHPHYVAVTCTNKVVVSDTGHHRIYIFDVNGKILGQFGSEGGGDGQFKLPRGVAVDEQGYIFVGDSGNNRIQIFSPDGIHIKSFGTWGSMDGEFKGLEGISVNSNGNIVVCDRESHRVCCF